MGILGKRNIDRLNERGITAESRGGTQTIELSTVGLAWLLNYIYDSRPQTRTVTLGLLKAVAGYSKSQRWRELRIKAVECQVYGGAVYYNLVFYLNGSPPRMFSSLYPETTNISSKVIIPVTGFAGLQLRDNQEVLILLSDEERRRLLAGEMLILGEEG